LGPVPQDGKPRKSLLLVSPSERDIFACVLAAHLEDIAQDFVMDPKFDGVLFAEKAQAIADRKFDVANLFVGIPADQIGPVEDRPAREEWKVDFQGYLARKRPASNSNSSDNRDLDEDPYTRALRFLDRD
jgi:hypothetical protein